MIQLRQLRGLREGGAAIGIEQEGIVDAEPQARRGAEIEVVGGLQLRVGRQGLRTRIAAATVEQVRPVGPGTGDVVVEQRLRLRLRGQPSLGVLHHGGLQGEQRGDALARHLFQVEQHRAGVDRPDQGKADRLGKLLHRRNGRQLIVDRQRPYAVEHGIADRHDRRTQVTLQRQMVGRQDHGRISPSRRRPQTPPMRCRATAH